jgi:hypothetical protein
MARSTIHGRARFLVEAKHKSSIAAGKNIDPALNTLLMLMARAASDTE